MCELALAFLFFWGCYSPESFCNPGKVYVPVVGVVGIVPAAVLVLAATANHIVGCDLTDIALRLVLEVFGAQLPCALELAHCRVNTAKSKVLAE